MTAQYTIKEAGYAFLYIANDNATQVDVYFDDVTMTQSKSNVIQSNEYYPFGMQTATSWTRENTTGNNFLSNGGTELNTLTQLYDLDFRNFDPILGRMTQVDPLADKYGSHTPYNFGYNNPVYWSDPSGAEGGSAEENQREWDKQNSEMRENIWKSMRQQMRDGRTYGSLMPTQDDSMFERISPANLLSRNDVYFTTPKGDRVSAREVLSVTNPNQNVLWRLLALQALTEKQGRATNGNGPGDGLWGSIVKWFSEDGHDDPRYIQYMADRKAHPETFEKMEMASMLVPIPGAAFGKLGKVVANPGLKITSISTHAMNQAITRGVTSPTILSIVRNPLVVLQQGSGNFLYLSKSGAAVLTSEGKLVTTYGSQFFDDTIKGIVGWFK